MNRPLASINDLRAEYDGKQVLHGITINIAHDDYIAITGPNGGGKTTFAKCLVGLKRPSGGTIEFFKDGAKAKHINIGYMPQYSAIDSKFPISVRQVILSGTLTGKRMAGGWSKKEMRDSDEMIEKMGLDGLASVSLGELSGGQRQRALLARAVIGKPDLLVLDEPNTYVDREHESMFYDLLGELNRQCAIVIISHDTPALAGRAKSLAYIDGTLEWMREACE